MAHYFENDPHQSYEAHSMAFELNERKFVLESSTGVFSHEKLDTGTRILLETVLKHQSPADSLLDFGCGIGVVGVVLGSFWSCPVCAVDVSEQACALAKKNFAKYQIQGRVLCQDGLNELDETYDCILLNPPIRTGKETIYRLFEQALAHLKTEGTFWIVMRKQHGAASAVKFLESLNASVERVVRDKGYWILKVKKK